MNKQIDMLSRPKNWEEQVAKYPYLKAHGKACVRYAIWTYIAITLVVTIFSNVYMLMLSPIYAGFPSLFVYILLVRRAIPKQDRLTSASIPQDESKLRSCDLSNNVNTFYHSNN
jgi:hypothetical protein